MSAFIYWLPTQIKDSIPHITYVYIMIMHSYVTKQLLNLRMLSSNTLKFQTTAQLFQCHKLHMYKVLFIDYQTLETVLLNKKWPAGLQK